MAIANLKPSSKGVTFMIIAAVLILFVCVLGYMAAAGELKSACTELKKKEAEVKASKQIAQKLEKSSLDYLDAQSQVRCLESSVSTQDYIPTLLQQIEHLGESVNLKVAGVRPGKQETAEQTRTISSGAKAAEGNVEAASKTNKNAGNSQAQASAVKPYDELNIDLEVEGKYMNALDFLYKLTNFPKIIAVNTMDMTPVSTDVGYGSPRLSIKVKVTAFILKDTGEASPETDNKPVAGISPASKGGTGSEAG